MQLFLESILCRGNVEQAQTIELQKSLLEQMNNRLRETEEHIRQEIANRVSIRVSLIEQLQDSNHLDNVAGTKSFGGECT